MAARRLAVHCVGTAAVGVPLLVAGLVLASPVHADAQSYVNDMHNAGITSAGGDSDLLQTGRTVCDLIASGVTPTDVAAQILNNSDSHEGSGGINPEQANDIVNFAMSDLCPNT